MPKPSHTSPKQISDAFIRELEAFKRGGYRFPDSGRELFEGTQREAFDAYLDGLKAKHREGYYEIPTGVGKTALFIAIIGCYLRATENIPDAPRVLIHEPTTDLVIQTAQSFADFLPDIAKRMEADDDCGRQIDWANSQIDVHYTGRRGARNKPNVLITTYQGQAADQRKPEERRIHNPAEFGLVIHDEAHFLTGRKFGPAAVDKFKGAIQLGVTATPEYSKDKTVANKLGHRYYHLPLNTAIERGDLCHVRPIVLKTHLRGKDAINLERAREFFHQRQGRPLTDKQLEQLLNQEARNQAIIKAYLTGSHPDTAERFLGQTGLIFAGGITHCNDFILHTERVLNQPAYRPITKWLRDEGVALIAPIHSDMPRDGVEIDFGGQRRKCTKDEIKELHRQGTILLIISDQELKLGSDFPMDSFIVDAVDRFSVPDATQRMGRGFRVDRGDARRNLPPNPDKSCVAINVIDETTHEMYSGTPHHPIHASEILKGAEHRPPGRRVGALTRFKEQPPEVSETLEALGFEFLTHTEVLRGCTRMFEEGNRDALLAPSNWKTGFALATECKGNNTDITRKISAYATWKEQQHIQSGIPVSEARERVFKESAGMYIGSNYKRALHLSPSGKQEMLDIGMLEPLTQRAPIAPKEWLTGSQLQESYLGGCDVLSQKIHDYASWQKQQHVESGIVDGEAADRVFKETAGVYTGKQGAQAWHVSPAAVHDMLDKGLLKHRTQCAPRAPVDWVTGTQLQSDHIGNNNTIDQKIQDYAKWKRQHLIDSGMAEDHAAEKVLNESAGLYTTKNGAEAWYVSPAGKQEMLEQGVLKHKSQRAPSAPSGWTTGNRLMKEYIGSNHMLDRKLHEYALWKRQQHIQSGMSADEATLKVFTESVGIYAAKIGKEVWHISPAGIAELREHGILVMREREQSAESSALSREHLKTQRQTKKDISPGSDDLERIGRSRGKLVD